MDLIIVTPNGDYPPSKLMAGFPATHAIQVGENRTLCGRDCEGWMIQNLDPYLGFVKRDDYVSCKICRKIMNKSRD